MLEGKTCLTYLNGFDIIVLIEVKCSYAFSVAGFGVLRSSNRGMRGGVAVLVKNNLWRSVFDVQSLHDQVWFKLSYMPDVRIGACYIPPADSPYFSHSSFGEVQSQILGGDNNVIAIGDFNSRMPSLHKLNDSTQCILYSQNVDVCENGHGRELLSMCINLGIYPVNHLNHKNRSFLGNKTFRKGNKWISQLDWLLVSPSLLHLIEDFTVEQRAPFLSDHAALSVRLTRPPPSVDTTLERARMLGTYPDRKGHVSRKAVSINSISGEGFNAALPDPVLWWQQLCSSETDEPLSVDEFCNKLTDVLYSVCSTARRSDRPTHEKVRGVAHDAQSRWQFLLRKNDPKAIWASINWAGKIEFRDEDKTRPNDDVFRRHFETLLNPSLAGAELTVPQTAMCVPILDNPISMGEIRDVISRLCRDKAAGTDGIPPGILKLLDGEWLIILTHLFNMVFDGAYPDQWSIAKVFTIFKKGRTDDPNNYRGISIQAALAKVYDGVLRNRFELWFQPDDEQAGGRAGRGCAEQLFTLRLLIEYARKTRKTLYVAYIDYIKAYDKLDRNILLQKLADQGCGNRYLTALANTLKNTRNSLGNAIFTSSTGVKQGAANSCSLFTFYINSTVKAIKQFGSDGFLEHLHCLLFMDDTVVLATSREAMQQKLKLLYQEAEAIRMEIHPLKSKYMVVNSKDNLPFNLHDITIGYTDEYVYLGTPIKNASLITQVKAHIDLKRGHLIKFSSFLKKNAEAPFSVKELVFKSALSSAVLYGCESWLCSDIKSATAPILSAQKQLLSVRNQTCTDLVRAELEYPDTTAIVKESQRKFIDKLESRDNYIGSPAHFAVNLASRAGTKAGTYIDTLMQCEPGSFRAASLDDLESKFLRPVSSRRLTYCQFNPHLKRHPIYKENVPEYMRIAFTRIRLGSHRLRIETGRWSRIPVEGRLCSCGAIQTEQHVLLACPVTEPLRGTFPDLNFKDLGSLMEANALDLARFCYMVLKQFEGGQ